MGSDTTRSAHGFHRVRDSPQRCGLSWACCPAAFSVRPVCPGPLLPALLPNSMRDSTLRVPRTCDAGGVRLANLTTEHPTFAATATELLAHVPLCQPQLRRIEQSIH